MTTLINESTPIEEYQVSGRTVYVKREDLSTNPPAPHLAKLRGVYKRLVELKRQGFTLIGVLDTRISVSGWGVGVIAKELGMGVLNFYPELKAYDGKVPERQQRAAECGCKIYPLKAGRTAILYARARKLTEALGGYMMPMGLVVKESVDEVARIASMLPEEVLMGDVVLSVGSGMVLAGLIKGLKSYNNIYGISAGMNTAKQQKRIKSMGIEIPDTVIMILEEGEDYYRAETLKPPFESSPYYDAKAWSWLVRHIDQLNEPILFWNIGS